MKLATIICYCSNDERFIRKTIDNALKVSDQVIVPVSSHWWDGTPEDMESVTNLANEYPNVNVTSFEWEQGNHTRYGLLTARNIGVSLVDDDIDWVLFLDADEIIDVKAFNEFLKEFPFENYDSIKIANYTYFREPIYRSLSFEDSAVMVRKEYAVNDSSLSGLDREQYYDLNNVYQLRKKRMVLHNNLPLIHHFSWVRTKEQMITKVTTWGHRNDTDWISLVNEEFSRDFNGKSFYNNDSYEIVENLYNI
tara:strand:- start:1515 stop:2267 length:753 start_codon:yes stop_codon:yes gene_type:complete